MTYTHYTSDGGIVDDWNFLNLHAGVGVGVYQASWPKIEAEWFMAAKGCHKVQINHSNSNESFGVAFNSSGSTLVFPNINDLPEAGIVTLRFAKTSGGGVFSLWADDAMTHSGDPSHSAWSKQQCQAVLSTSQVSR